MAKGIKTGGREKGSLNKTTVELKAKLHQLIGNEIESIDNVLLGLDPKERLDILIRLLPYVMPKQNQIALDHTFQLNIPPLNSSGGIPDIANRKPKIEAT